MAAALSRGRGVAGVRTTKGLFFIFTLLCLVSLASSLFDKDELENFKEEAQKIQQNLDFEKVKWATYSEIMSEYMSLLDPMIVLVKKVSKVVPEFPPLDGVLEKTKVFMEKINEQNEDFGAELESAEKELGKMKKLIQFLEEQQADL